MDEGLAAVIAGMAGAIGGVSGGVVGAVSTARAMARQVRDQATTEHGQWLRGQRMEAYLTLLQEWDAAHKRLKRIWTRAVDAYYEDSLAMLEGDIGDICNMLLDGVEEAVAPTATAFERVAMLGPREMDDVVFGLEAALQELRSVTETRLGPDEARTSSQSASWEPWNGTDSAAAGARQAFVECVRRVLGSPPTPTSEPSA
ncbi:hypothetical protein [Streptomyces sp. NBC_00467]|uniref:hypothetical protein n=1 Tax=Streptomyces sp. NBC_00467 TaxID=2975752 RepID=UPI002E197DBD